ncbi:MAG TPA: TIGR00725 family protein [Methanotrichaceae archaeon]|nr:TIGR00725 family protein [Methanotrichaceae archaeon]
MIGGGECSDEAWNMAQELGRSLALKGHVVICGGLGGVMEAVCMGARDAKGTTVGVLPGDVGNQNAYVDIAIATGMGHARNAIIVRSADVVIALPGEYGTLSEIALALKMGKKVISLKSWNVPGAISCENAEEAIRLLEKSE